MCGNSNLRRAYAAGAFALYFFWTCRQSVQSPGGSRAREKNRGGGSSLRVSGMLFQTECGSRFFFAFELGTFFGWRLLHLSTSSVRKGQFHSWSTELFQSRLVSKVFTFRKSPPGAMGYKPRLPSNACFLFVCRGGPL